MITINTEFQNVKFDTDVAKMFASIINNDEWLKVVFLYIMKRYKQEKDFKGVTINDITKDVEIIRPVKVGNKRKYHFEKKKINIERNAANKIVEKLTYMSLLYFESLKPYKIYFPTNRAVQVLMELSNIIKDEKKGDSVHG